MAVNIQNLNPAVQPFVIAEDSTLRKGLTYIPLIGILNELYSVSSLKSKIANEVASENKIRLIEVINDYKSRTKFVLGALIITSITLNLFFGPVSFLANLVFLLPVSDSYFKIRDKISMNEMVINDLRNPNQMDPVRYLRA